MQCSPRTDPFFREQLRDWCSRPPVAGEGGGGNPRCTEGAAGASLPVWGRQPHLPHLLPLSGGPWLPVLDWARPSRPDTSLSSAPRKLSRKESGLWSSWRKCLAAQARGEMMRRDNLEGHRPAARAERKETEAPSQRAGAGVEMPAGCGSQGRAQVCTPPPAPHSPEPFLPSASATWDGASVIRDVSSLWLYPYNTWTPSKA